MSNHYFKFRRFTIFQDRCAMKVCTDACLFGAWVAKHFELDQPKNILDIGTGTGLLTLMLAQKLTGTIDTIEIDYDAYEQASENISKTDWKERVSIIKADVKAHRFKNTYELIISNPPFYENDLRSSSVAANMAKHDESLTLEDLLSLAGLQLTSNGSLALLIPYHRLKYCIDTAANFNLFPAVLVNVKQSEHHFFFRSIIIFKKSLSLNVSETAWSIKNKKSYSSEFTGLLKDYYLYL